MSRGPQLALALALAIAVVPGCSGDDTTTGSRPDAGGSPTGQPEPSTAVPPTMVEGPGWIVLGTASDDSSFGLDATSDGGIVVAAWTSADLATAGAGDRDVWVGRIGADGDTTWEIQFGSTGRDSPLGIDVGESDVAFTGGYTDGDLVDTTRGKVDGWVGRIEADGERGWTTQFGGPDWDRVFDVSAADRTIYATGYTLGDLAPVPGDGRVPGGNDGFVTAFDPTTGAQRWLTLIGTSESDWGQGSSATGEGGVVITGYTTGDLGEDNAGGKDAFVARVDPEGTVEWTAQLGSIGEDWTQGVGVDPSGGAIAVAGHTDGDLGGRSAGEEDAVVAVFEDDGTHSWTRQFGTAGIDLAFEPRFSGDHVVVTGTTSGRLGSSHAGGRDAFVAWLDARTGEVDRIEQFGTETDDEAYGLAVAAGGTVWAGGSTGASISEGVTTGDTDFWIRRFPPTTESG